MAKTRRINVASGFGYRSQKPFVSLQLGDEFCQMPPDQAREIAANLFTAAEAAETDGFIMQWCDQWLGLNEQQRAMFLCEFREYREQALGQRHAHGPEPGGEEPPTK